MIEQRSYLFLALLGIVAAGPTLAQSDKVYLGSDQVERFNQVEEETKQKIREREQRIAEKEQEKQEQLQAAAQSTMDGSDSNNNPSQSAPQIVDPATPLLNNPDAAREVFDEADADSSGTLTPEEYEDMAEAQEEAGFDIVSDFDDLDTNEDDVLLPAELSLQRRNVDVEDDF